MRDIKTFENINIGYDVNIIESQKAPEYFPLHWHRYIEILMLPEDENYKTYIEILVEDNKVVLRPGEICFIWPGQLHSIVDNKCKKVVGFQFIPELFNEFSDFDPYKNQLHKICHIEYDKHPELLMILNMHLQRIVELQGKQPRFYHIEKIIHLIELFMELVNAMVAGLEMNASYNDEKESAQRKIYNACIYISNNATEDITLDEISERVGLSSSYFSRVFKQITGDNFVEYLLGERVKKSQKLLADTSMSITEVSYSSGFKSISTFNRVFRQVSGCSPTEYRKYRME